MQALLVIDVQNGLLNKGDFTNEKTKIRKVIESFQKKDQLIVFLRHIDDSGPLAVGTEGAAIVPEFEKHARHIVEKRTPSAFKNTELDALLKARDVDHIFITGFNTEYCCLFSAIAAYERGYQVTFIEDATGTVNGAADYEMPGLDINDFVGSVLNWSNTVEVLYFDEYVNQYGDPSGR